MEKNIDIDLMLMALLTKGLEIINIEPSTQYDGLRKVFESEIKTIKTRLGNILPSTERSQEKSSRMADEDKQFIIDEILDIIGGKLGDTKTWQSNPFASKYNSQFLGDFLSAAYKTDWDAFEKEEKEDAIAKRKAEKNTIIKNNNIIPQKIKKR